VPWSNFASGCRLWCCADGTALLVLQGVAVARGGHYCARSPSRSIAAPSAPSPARLGSTQSLQVQLPWRRRLRRRTSAAPGSTVRALRHCRSGGSATAHPCSVIERQRPSCSPSPAVAGGHDDDPDRGGSGRPDATASPTPSSSSPSESASSTAGAAARACRLHGVWDSATHMTKAEWRSACMRSGNRLANLKPETVGLGPAERQALKAWLSTRAASPNPAPGVARSKPT